MSTQEFSQWVVDGNLERSNKHNTLTYMPGQSGYVGFEDIELSITQHETQVDITPQVESRSEIFPENKRFVEPETPVPGSRNVGGDSSGGTHEFQTPQLPTNPFENPFGPVHEEDGGGGMALSQIFKATQAPSSPNLPRHMPSSQRPSPVVLQKGAIDITSGIVLQISPDTGELMELIEDPTLSSPHDSIASNQDPNECRRTHEEDDSSSRSGGLNSVDKVLVGDKVARGTKRKRSSRAQTVQQANTRAQNSTKLSRNIRGDQVHQVTGSEPTSKAIVIEDEVNTSEDETEHEEGSDDDGIDKHEDDSEGNKENRIVQQDLVPVPGSHIKRASRGLQNQFIPLSSSPTSTKQTAPYIEVDERMPLQRRLFSRKEDEITGPSHSNEQIAIADSQTSQKLRSRLDRNEDRPQIGSSNDSRKVIPQSQAVKLASSLHVTSEVRKTASQQTVSPPDSTMDEDLHNVLTKPPQNNQSVDLLVQNKPVSPRSSPPILNHQYKLTTEHNTSLQPKFSRDLAEKTITVPENANTQSSQPEDHTHEVGIIRSSSAVPETTYINRHGGAYSTSFPARLGNPFSAAEEMDFSFTSHSQVAEDTSMGGQRLAASFGSHRPDIVLKSPLRRSPRRPRTFSAIADDFNTQEQDSLELDTIFTIEDQEIRDVLARMPGSGSSPLDPVRRRKQRKAPILLDEPQSDGLESRSKETTPVPTKVVQDRVLFTKGMVPEVQQHLEAQNVEINGESREPSTNNKHAFDEPITFMEHSVPQEQYGRKARRRNVIQAKSGGAKTAQRFASTAPAPKVSEKSSANTVRSEQKTKIKASSQAKKAFPSSAVVDTRKPSNRISKTGLSVAIQTPCLVLPSSSMPSANAVVPNRVFAEFRGSPAGFFAATCLDCWKGEAELKYSIRFDDGTIDQLGQPLIKRLELHIGDQVKIDRRQYKSNTFIVTGFGHEQDETLLENEPFPTTDIYGHATIRVKLETNGKKKSAETEDLEVPITEVFFTRGMRSAFRDREYSHTSVHPKPLATPTDSRLPSSTVSPHSRTRSTNKLNLAASMLPDRNNKTTSADQLLLPANGLFKDIVFIFTNNPNIKQYTSDAIEREGGTILKGQKDIEDLFDTPHAHNPIGVQNSKVDFVAVTGISIRPKYKETRLAVLVADTVCRTTKYYQALALGIPCVSSRWIVDCLQFRRLKSWRPYLLAAGESEILSTTVSQQLNFTRDEIDSCYIPLNTLIARREQWLQNATILLVGNGGDDCDKRLGAYTFFAWTLGATNVTVVGSSKEAEQYLAKGEHHFDWICIDNEKDKNTSRGDRKVKRMAEMNFAGLAKSGMESVKVIDTRHVTESLILGSLVDVKDL